MGVFPVCEREEGIFPSRHGVLNILTSECDVCGMCLSVGGWVGGWVGNGAFAPHNSASPRPLCAAPAACKPQILLTTGALDKSMRLL